MNDNGDMTAELIDLFECAANFKPQLIYFLEVKHVLKIISPLIETRSKAFSTG